MSNKMLSARWKSAALRLRELLSLQDAVQLLLIDSHGPTASIERCEHSNMLHRLLWDWRGIPTRWLSGCIRLFLSRVGQLIFRIYALLLCCSIH